MGTRTEDLAEAMLAIARVNHYMVGLVEPVTYDELTGAQQVLIDQQNAQPEGSEVWQQCDLALDLLEDMEKRQAYKTE